MAFKRKAIQRVTRYIKAKRSARRSHKSSSSGLTPLNVIMAGAVYGAVRPHVAKVLPDMFSFGPVDSDNVIIAGASWYGMKKTTGFMKALSTVALAGEVGIVSARLSSNLMQDSSVSNTSASDSYNY